MKVMIVFKTGFQLSITCEDFSLIKSGGTLLGYKAKGITDNKPAYFNFNDVLCIYRDLNAERGGEQHE